MPKKSKKASAKKPAKRKGAKGASAAAVGRHLDISRQRVGQLEAEGVFPKNSAGRFDLDPCRFAYIRWLRDENRRGSKSAGQSRAQEARAREIELRIAREEGRVIPIDDVHAVVTDILGSFRAELAGVSAASTRDLAVRDAIEGHLNAAIERCRQRFEQAESDLRSGRDVLVDSEEGNA